MKIIDITIFIIMVSLSNVSFCQKNLRSAIEVNFDLGFTKVLSPSTSYTQFTSPENLEISKMWFARSKNISFNYLQFITPKHGVKITFGVAQYGFDFDGRLESSRTRISGSYRSNYLEWGTSFIYRFALSESTKFIIEPGLRYHSDASGQSDAINFWDKDSLSFSGYTGIEIPMAGSNYFTNFGLLFKIPLQRYNYHSDGNSALYPYFIGLRLGVNFQFNWSSKFFSLFY